MRKYLYASHNTDHRLHLPMMSRVVLVSILHPKEYFDIKHSHIQINILPPRITV